MYTHPEYIGTQLCSPEEISSGEHKGAMLPPFEPPGRLHPRAKAQGLRRKGNKKDSHNIEKFFNQIIHLSDIYQKLVGCPHPEMKKITKIIQLFPGLVIPLELREDASVIRDAIDNKTALHYIPSKKC